MIVYDREQKQIVIPNGLGNVNIVINQGCDDDKPTPPQDGWGMTGYFNNWGGTPDIPFEEDGELEGRPYKVIRGFEAVQGEFKIRRNNAWTDSYTATFENIPQFAKLKKGDMNMQINDGVWDIYLFFGDDGVPNEMLVLNPGTDLSTIQYEYTLNLSADKESAIFLIGDSFDYSAKNYYGGTATIPMKYGCRYSINVFMEGYEDIFEEITCYNDEERSYTLTKIKSYNLINPIVFSEEAGNTINAENVQIPTFLYEGNQYYNVDSFNLADIEEFKIHILFKPNNSDDGEPINVFGCEDTDWDDTTFGARIYQGQIYFRMSGEDVAYPYNVLAWYDVEMGYNTTKKWVIVNGETLLDAEYASFNRPSQTLMIGAINSGGNAFRPFYGNIAAIYIKSNANQIYLLPKEDGTMGVYWNNLTNSRNSISGENNARFENDFISGDGMKSITWLGNLEDKWVTPSMSERDDNGYIVVSPSEGYNGLSRTVINPQTIYNEGIEAGKTEGEASLAAKARVLNVTENGNYLSKFSDPIIPANVTGVYADGTNFYNYAELNGKVFNTNIPATKDSRIELWWKNDGSYVELGAIIGAQNDNIFKFVEFSPENEYRIEYGYPYGDSFFAHNFTYNLTSQWNHIIFSKQDGLNVNGELICEIQGEGWRENAAISNFWINASYNGEVSINANGYFGMIKIDDTIIIPTADGFQNTNTGELLEVVQDGSYKFIENLPTYGEGELYKTVNVNVLPKVNVKEAGLRFGYSTFTEVPDWADFEGITNMRDMFTWCENIKTIPLIDTSNVTHMTYMFNNCTNLQTIPLIDTSNVIYMGSMFYKCPNLQTIPLIDTSNVIYMSFMFYECNSLQTIPQLDTSKVIDMSYMFCYCGNLQTIPLINTSNVTNMDNMFRDCPKLQTIPPLNTSKVTTMESTFGECRSLTSLPALNAQSLNIPSYIGIFGYSELPNLTDFGGFLNLKCSLTNDNNLQRLPNLTKESCINVLNGLYDFTGNGETPNENQGQLKVAQSFIDKVGDEISIGINKGWQITV